MKITKRIALELAILTVENDRVFTYGEDSFTGTEVIEKLNNMIISLEKGPIEKKPTPNQVANGFLKEDIVNTLSDGKTRTISEIIKDTKKLEGFSNQKVSALTRQLILSGLVKKETEKGKSIFSLA